MNHSATLAVVLALTITGVVGCGATNTYWYCWDTGAASPHHAGHPVSNDHVCSDGELKDNPPPGSEADGIDHSSP